MNIEDIARYYIDTPAYDLSPSVVKGFRQLIVDLAQVELQGIEFQYVNFFPYMKGTELSLEHIYRDYDAGKLMITTQFNNSELLGPDINLLFRCIHEVHHIKLNVGFDLAGEFATAVHLIEKTDNLLFKQILFSESLGQIAVRLCQGKFPDYQKVVLFEPEVLHCLKKEGKSLLN